MHWIGTRNLALFGALVCIVVACGSEGDPMSDRPAGANYFSSPEAAVSKITELLRQEKFETLAAYYDLSDSDVPLEELKSGAFFIREERPDVAHPGGFWRYRHPFAPGFEYQSARAVGDSGIHVIEVEISIEQGAGSPPQVGRATFKMIRSSRGWQVLPDPIGDGEPQEMPHVDGAD